VRRSLQAGFTLIEILIVVAIVSMLAAIAIPSYTNVLYKSRRAALIADADVLYSSLLRFNVDTGAYPTLGGQPETSFNVFTLHPLSTDGYFTNVESLVNKLYDGRVGVYVSPVSDQFWMVLRMQEDPFILVIAHTSLFPINSGTWYDGVYAIQEGEMTPVSQVR